MVGKNFVVTARWDDEALVWYATSDDVPGLALEAESMEALVTKVRAAVPELLELNGILPTEKPREVAYLHLRAEYQERIALG
ncbi:MAG: hypothetical protein BMS9Abin01_2659 [Gammaproteobacteria bacterium]|jgi:Domain of unknown function (DUF1902)|nr:MAG: hypothetical protein BMS9Abin01_2659 [Gammaproteobacteria bacterium]